MHTRRWRRTMALEHLEDRMLLTSVAYLDFGDSFPAGGLDMTVLQLRDTFANGGIQGPDFREFDTNNNLVDYADGLGLQFTAMAPLVTFDYNGVGGVNATDYSDLRAAVLNLAQRFYNNLDVNVVLAPILDNTSDATYLQGIRDTLNLGAAADGERDAWVFVANVIRTDNNSSVGGDKKLNGQAAGADIGGNNARDDVAIAFADSVLGGNLNATADTRLAYTAAHEAAHTFGQRHRNNGTSGTALDATMAQLTGSELVTESAGATNRTNFVFNTRYPLIRGDGNNNPPPATNSFNANDVENQYTQLAGNNRLGVRAGAPDFVSGTGAHDRITVTRLNATQATVTVQAFRSPFGSPITVPGQAGSVFSYTINTTNGILVEGGFGTDQITIDATINSVITVRGMAGTADQLIVAGGGLASGTYTPSGTLSRGLDGNLDFRGQIAIAGGATINFEEFQASGSINVQNLGSFTLMTPNIVDVVDISRPIIGSNRIAGSSNFVPFVPLLFSNIASFVLDTGTNDNSSGNDQVTLNNGLDATGLQNFTLNTGAGNDQVTINFTNLNLPVAGGAFTFNGGTGGIDTLVFTGAGPAGVIYTPDGFNDPSRGMLTIKGTSMLFTGLEFVRPVTPIVTAVLTSTNVLNEGESLTLTVDFLDPGSMSTHVLTIDWGDGLSPSVINVGGRVVTRAIQVAHTYLDDNPSGTPFDLNSITATIRDDDGLISPVNIVPVVTVHNVDPVITSFHAGAESDDKAREGMPIFATGSFTDIGVLDTHTVRIDWGDGSISDADVVEANGSGAFSSSHVYVVGGIYTVRVLLKDDDTGEDAALDTVFITGASIQVVDGKRVLQVVGTNDADNVIVDEPGSGRVNVYAAFLPGLTHRRVFNRADFDYVQVVLCGGDDRGTVSGWVTFLSIVDGGRGNDILTGGRGGIVLIGGEGNDWLAGSTQRSILIGGDGEDELIGRADDDILIGGRTSYDSGVDEDKLANDAGLIRLLQEWKGIVPAVVRKANIEAGVDGFYLRLGETVLDDGGAKDRLTGSTGADWFWQFKNDELRDYRAGVDLLTADPAAAAVELFVAPSRGKPSARTAFVS
ncbi:MAG: hypothetical protein WD468_09235 [Pirellulales bacterium]